MSEDKLPEMFKYTSPIVPNDCYHKIGPSQIDKFFSAPKLYYQENIAGKDRQFQGNTATVLGTICHYIYNAVTIGKKVDRESINEQLDIFNKLKPELELDVDDIKNSYPLITGVVVNQYLLPAQAKGGFIKSEESVVLKIEEGIYLAGTCDRIENDCIVDFKTVKTKPDENEIPFHYLIQLLAYAYAFSQKGHKINRIKLVYGVKPTKTLPARCFEVSKVITLEDEQLIKNTLKLMAESIIICKDKPELIYLIFKSMELKNEKKIFS